MNFNSYVSLTLLLFQQQVKQIANSVIRQPPSVTRPDEFISENGTLRV